MTETCSTQNPTIKRSNDGLFIHHIMECEFPDLSQKNKAILKPFEWQKGINLVYCNYFEHLLLHIDIVLEFMTKEFIGIDYKNRPIVVVGMGGLINHILPEIVDYINGYKYQSSNYINALRIIDGNEMLFVEIIKNFENELKKSIHGSKDISAGVMQGMCAPNFFRGKTIIRGEKINDLLFDYDVAHGYICPPTINEIKEKINGILYAEKALIINYGCHFGNSKEYFVKYRNKRGIKNRIFLLKETDYKDQIDKFIQQSTDKFTTCLKGNSCIFVPKNSNLQPKKCKKKNKYNFAINGIVLKKPIYSLRTMQLLINECKKQYS